MNRDFYVVVAERDTYDPMQSNGPIIFEQNLGGQHSTLEAARKRAEHLSKSYGLTKVAKLKFVDDESFKEIPSDTKTEDDFWFVFNPQGEKPTFRHFAESLAIAEAERLASENPGNTFIVLHSVCSRKVGKIEKTQYMPSQIPF